MAGALNGIEPVWASEIEPFPIRVTKLRFPNMKHLGSVTEVHGDQIEPVDVITFGSPCQDLSIAGKQKGLDGARSGLYKEAVRVIREMKEATNGQYPKYCVFENVPGLLSSNKGNDFLVALDMLQEGGYIPDPNILDAQHMGVPQRRKRVYIAWLNVDYILQKKTNLSRIITLQLLTELLQTSLVERLRALENVPAKLAVLPRKLSEDGAKKRIKLFSLHQEDRLQMLQENLDEIQAIYQNERENWDLLAGEDRTEEESLITMAMRSNDLTKVFRPWYIAGSLKEVLEDLSQAKKSSTTSTSTKEITGLKISTCFRTLGNIANVIAVYTNWLAREEPQLLKSLEWVQSFLTEMRVCINAGQTYEKSFGYMGWYDNIWFCDRAVSAIEKHLIADFGSERAGEILFKPESMQWDPSQSGTVWQRTAGNVKGSPGGSDNACGFYGKASATAGSIGYGRVSPTLKAGQESHVVYCLQGNGIDRSDTAGCNGKGWSDGGGVSYTLNTIDRPAIVYKESRKGYWTEGFGRLRAEGENRQSRPGHVIVLNDQGGAVMDVSDKAMTLRAQEHGHQPVVVHDARGNGDGRVCPTLTGDHENRITDYTAIATFVQPSFGEFKASDKAQALKASDGKRVDPGAVILESAEKHQRKYIVRRLTPTECGRLQGFPDGWCDGAEGSDSAMYKLWGNGISLPCAYDVLHRIAEELTK